MQFPRASKDRLILAPKIMKIKKSEEYDRIEVI
jgi:hypothetical protein